MRPISLSAVAVVGLAFMVAGCSVVTNMTTVKRNFTVAVRNDTGGPMKVGLAKSGPPAEEGWASAEDVAIANAKEPDASWGQLVQPGQSATIGPVDGRFSEGVLGLLRVYAGEPTMSDMLAISRGSPNRLDLPLRPGVNRFVIFDDGGRIAAKRLPEPAPAEIATASAGR